jgi:hypothetical protein
VVAEVKALACELPAITGVPLSKWSCADLAREVMDRHITEAISADTVWRILTDDAIKPWLHCSWIFPRDPHFASKAAVVLDLYARIFEGKVLDDDEFVICADEKTSIQARCRCHPTLPPGRARMMRVEHEYDRRGAVAYLAAYDVHRARVLGRTADTTGIVPFGQLVEQVMTAEPYASAKRVFWIVDNGSSHRGQASIARLEGTWPTLRLIHLPIHASWLDQVEIYFSIVQRKVVNPNNFFDTDQIAHRLAAFEDRYNSAAEPFDWRFGRDDLDKFLARLEVHQAVSAPEPRIASNGHTRPGPLETGAATRASSTRTMAGLARPEDPLPRRLRLRHWPRSRGATIAMPSSMARLPRRLGLRLLAR